MRIEVSGKFFVKFSSIKLFENDPAVPSLMFKVYR
jgi:hypothetical protein